MEATVRGECFLLRKEAKYMTKYHYLVKNIYIYILNDIQKINPELLFWLHDMRTLVHAKKLN